LRALVRPHHARGALALGLITVVALLVPATSAWAGIIAPEGGGSPNADAIRELYLIIFGIGLVMFVGVGGLLLYTLRRFRARKGAVAVQIHGNTRLEIAWTIGAALILVLIAVVTFVKLPDIRNPPDSSASGLQGSFVASSKAERILPPSGKSLDIEVNGQQYVWRYTYPDGDKINLNNVFSYQEMVVPTDTTVTLTIRSQDVAHSWWIPQLGGKFDAIPGSTNYTWFKISKPGLYTGQCAELCGRNHANMTAQVRALPLAEFEAWYAQQKSAILVANKAAAATRAQQDADAAARLKTAAVRSGAVTTAVDALAEGKQLFVAGNPATAAASCASCHTLKAAGAAGKVGPNLDAMLGGDNAASIREMIVNPNKEVPKPYVKGIMPADYGKTLTAKQLDALVKFVYASTHGK
jgi:cytochrome c oxidase subunit 2